eukprot:Amastigsp_a508862_9.p5 type:complete len:162 gc:universal Amastigsp_a508862_9:2433-1948(-)
MRTGSFPRRKATLSTRRTLTSRAPLRTSERSSPSVSARSARPQTSSTRPRTSSLLSLRCEPSLRRSPPHSARPSSSITSLSAAHSISPFSKGSPLSTTTSRTLFCGSGGRQQTPRTRCSSPLTTTLRWAPLRRPTPRPASAFCSRSSVLLRSGLRCPTPWS